jgi:hypothetical protein
MQPHSASNNAPALISAVATADKSPRRAINAAPRGLPATTKEEEERGAGEERRGRINGEWGSLELRVDFIGFSGSETGGSEINVIVFFPLLRI